MTDSSSKDTLEVSDINQLVLLLQKWHGLKVKQLEHLLDMPEGTKAAHEEGPEIILEGEKLEAFKIGLHTALSHMGTLPFEVSEVDAPIQ